MTTLKILFDKDYSKVRRALKFRLLKNCCVFWMSLSYFVLANDQFDIYCIAYLAYAFQAILPLEYNFCFHCKFIKKCTVNFRSQDLLQKIFNNYLQGKRFPNQHKKSLSFCLICILGMCDEYLKFVSEMSPKNVKMSESKKSRTYQFSQKWVKRKMFGQILIIRIIYFYNSWSKICSCILRHF